MTGGCLLVAFAPDEGAGNDDDMKTYLVFLLAAIHLFINLFSKYGLRHNHLSLSLWMVK